MGNTVNNINSEKNRGCKKIFNLKVEKLIREASDNFVYYRDCETALEQINEALSIEPDHIKALILKGDILFCIDKDKEALEYFDKAINTNPYSAEAYGSKAGTLDVLGYQKEALQYCDKAFENITLKDRHLLPALYDQKIAILIRMKKYEEARLALKKCIKNLPEEDGGYLISCYQSLIELACKEKRRKIEKVNMISLKLV